MRKRIHRGIFFLALAILLGLNLAHAQKGVFVSFTSDNRFSGQTFDARSSPAQVTSDDESALKSKGYVQIGLISATKESKKADPEITQQLQSAILKKAAEAGGDVVDFSMNGVLNTHEEGTGKFKGGTCVRYMTVAAGPPSAPYSQTREVCIRVEGGTEVMKTVGNQLSLGAVFRYDPKLVADIAARAEETAEAARKTAVATRIAEATEATRIEKIKAVGFPTLGNDINSAEMRTWLSNLGTPEISRYDTGDYYNFKSKGISMFFDYTHSLNAEFFYSEGADGFQQYQGDLPYGLSFQNTRKEIESILGPPDKSGGGAINIWTSYHSKGIGITYNTKQIDDMNARMYYVSIKAVP